MDPLQLLALRRDEGGNGVLVMGGLRLGEAEHVSDDGEQPLHRQPLARVAQHLAESDGECLADPRNHVRLRDRLPVPDRQGSVLVGAPALPLRDEQLPR